MLVLPAVAVDPLVLEDTVALAVEDPSADALLAVLACSPRGELQLPGTLALEREGQGDDGGEAVDAGKKGEKALLEQNLLRDTDRTVRDASRGVGDPVARPFDLGGGKLAELCHSEDQQRRLAFLSHASPVVAIVGNLGVDLECKVGESVGGQDGTGLEDGESIHDMSTGGDQLREVVLLEVSDESLDLLDRAFLVTVEQAIEGGEIVDKFSV